MALFEDDRRRRTPNKPGWFVLGGAGMYGASPLWRDACGRTAFLLGVILGKGATSSASDSGVGAGDVVFPFAGEVENLDEILENHEPLLWGGVPF